MAYPSYPYYYPTYPSEDWLFDEDRALRDLMKGVVVSDHENQHREVHAWFGHPDQELRAQDYPYITVDLIGISEGKDRVHRGNHYLADPPEWWGFQPLLPGQLGYLIEMPTPIDLDYQISTWARNPRHDRQLLKQMITGGRTRLRQGRLFTADGKNRRLDVLAHIKRDTVEDGKRLFNNVFRIRVSSEVPWTIIGGEIGAPYNVTDLYLSYRNHAQPGTDEIGNSVISLATVKAVTLERSQQYCDIEFSGDGLTVTRVPAVGNYTNYMEGDLVAVTKTLDSTGASTSGYRCLVIGLESRPVAISEGGPQ